MGLYSCTCAGYMFHFFQGKTWYYLERWHKKKTGYILKKAQKTDRFDGYGKFAFYISIPVLDLKMHFK